MRRVLAVLLWTAVIVFAVRFSVTAADDLSVGREVFTPAAIGSWVGLLALARVGDIAGWHLTVTAARQQQRAVPWSASARLLATSELIRYLPPGLLHFAARYRFGRRIGVDPAVVIGATAADLALRIAAALGLFALSVPLWPTIPTGYLVTSVLGVIVIALCLHPRVLRPALAMATRRLGGGRYFLPYRSVIAATAVFSLAWLIRGAASWQMAHAIAGVPLQDLPVVVAVTALAWVAGLVVPFSPGGLGVREAVGAGLLTAVMPLDAAVAVMLLSRLVSTVLEFAGAGILVVIDEAAMRRRPGRRSSGLGDPPDDPPPPPSCAAGAEGGPRPGPDLSRQLRRADDDPDRRRRMRAFEVARLAAPVGGQP